MGHCFSTSAPFTAALINQAQKENPLFTEVQLHKCQKSLISMSKCIQKNPNEPNTEMNKTNIEKITGIII